jgi:hypothetical protein
MHARNCCTCISVVTRPPLHNFVILRCRLTTSEPTHVLFWMTSSIVSNNKIFNKKSRRIVVVNGRMAEKVFGCVSYHHWRSKVASCWALITVFSHDAGSLLNGPVCQGRGAFLPMRPFTRTARSSVKVRVNGRIGINAPRPWQTGPFSRDPASCENTDTRAVKDRYHVASELFQIHPGSGVFYNQKNPDFVLSPFLLIRTIEKIDKNIVQNGQIVVKWETYWKCKKSILSFPTPC